MWQKKLISFLTLLALVCTLSISNVEMVFAEDDIEEILEEVEEELEEIEDDIEEDLEEMEEELEEDFEEEIEEILDAMDDELGEELEEILDEIEKEFEEEIEELEETLYEMEDKMDEEWSDDEWDDDEWDDDYWEDDWYGDDWGDDGWDEWWYGDDWEDEWDKDEWYYEDENWDDAWYGIDEYGCEYWINEDGYVDSYCPDEDELEWGDKDDWDYYHHYTYHDLEELYWLQSELRYLRDEFAYLELLIPEEFNMEISKFETASQKWIEYLENNDIDARPEGIEDFWGEGPWMLVEDVWMYLDAMIQVDDVKREIEWIKSDLEYAQSFIDVLEGIDELIGENLQDLTSSFSSIIIEASDLMDKMSNAVDNGEIDSWEVAEDYWDILWDLEDDAYYYMSEIVYEIDNDDALYNYLEENHQEIWKYFASMVSDPYDYNYYDDFSDEYGEWDVIETLPAELMEEVYQGFTEILWDELSGYMDDETIANITSNVITSLDFMEFDEIDDLIENHTKLRDDLDFNYEMSRLDELIEWLEMSIITDKYASEIEEVLQKIDSYIESGYTEEEIDDLLDILESLLEDNEYETIFGDTQYQYTDVKGNMNSAPEWYYAPIMELTFEDAVNGYKDELGNLTGEYGVADFVTKAEAMKMVIEIAGIDVELNEDGNHWAEEAGYIDYADEIGLYELVNYDNLNEYATREDVAIIVSEIMGWTIEDEECETEFEDYDGEFTCHVDAVNKMEVFEGDGETGDFAGDRNINRAETAKAFQKVLDSTKNLDTEEKLSEFESKYFAE